MPTLIHWAYIVDRGSGATVVRGSSSAITVQTTQAGNYIVTFPAAVQNSGCLATINNSVGFITAIPGDSTALAPNQVRVFTFSDQNSFTTHDFTVAVCCQVSWWQRIFDR